MRVLGVLVRVVREAYPSHYSLAEIAYIWGDATDGERQALDELEGENRAIASRTRSPK